MHNPDGLELYQKTIIPEIKNRLCICLSDLHFTDGTVGVQSRDDWSEFFDELETLCEDHQINECHLVLAGDILDFIRTSKWAEHGFYPWNRKHHLFDQVLQEIFNGILKQHDFNNSNSFFYRLKNLKKNLKAKGVSEVEIFVLLGNHDKELLLNQNILTQFYSKCLGLELSEISNEYRRWVGKLYGDETLFEDQSQAPWLPIYYGDLGFKLFVTHGQFRDPDNISPAKINFFKNMSTNISKKIDESILRKKTKHKNRWQLKSGWNLKLLQKNNFSPFLEPCFGDTVAAGILSTFIWRMKEAVPPTNESGVIQDLWKTLSDLDLFRPTYLGVKKIIDVINKLKDQKESQDLSSTVEFTFINCMFDWLKDPFVFKSAPGYRKYTLLFLKYVIIFCRKFHLQLELTAISIFLKSVDIVSRFSLLHKYSRRDFLNYPGLWKSYREKGFRIYCEGHTHVPFQMDFKFNDGGEATYINFGTWRDQIVEAIDNGYRRRSVGRVLYVYDLEPKQGESQRQFYFSVEDDLTWNDLKSV